jgi:type III secretion system FlhB-like substrate exporter
MEVVMRNRRRERGESQFGCLIGLILLGLAIFVAWKMIPVKVKAAELRQTVVDEAKSAGTHGDDRIRAAILAKARENALPVTENDIKIVRALGEITVTVTYTIPIPFPGYTYNWHLEHEAKNPIF